MAGIISASTAALIGAGLTAAASGAGTIASMSAANQKAGAQNAAVRAAEGGSASQYALQNEILRQQREFQIAPQYDSDGNRVVYVPGRGWMPLLSERGLQRQAAQQGAQDTETRKYFGRAQMEDNAAYLRRLKEGSIADSLIEQMRNQYGAPTREGVTGSAKIAGVTPLGEAAQNLKAGAAGSVLRSGGNVGGLEAQFNALDKNASTGQRSALAAVDATPGIYDDVLDKWRAGKLAGYKALIPQPPGTAPPTSGQEALTAQIANRSQRPYSVSPYAGASAAAANRDLINALGQNTNTFPTGTYGGLADAGNELLKAFNTWWGSGDSKQSSLTPGTPGYGGFGEVGKTRSGSAYG